MSTFGETSSHSAAPEPQRTGSYWLALAGLYVCAAVLLACTWRRWPDVLVDFGRELYVPWRLANGAVLYRDVAYFNGPLSPYLNALLFRVFGASVSTLVFANTFLLGILLTVMFRLATQMFRVTTAWIACACFLPLFAFSHMLRNGNYNYICPYSHEMTHGIVIAFLIMGLWFSRNRGRWWCLGLIGLLWGCAFLGKAELFLATSGMLVFAFGLAAMSERVGWKVVFARAGWILVGAVIPACGFTIWLACWMDGWEALRGVLGTWSWIVGTEVSGEFFYRRMTGWETPVWSLLAIVRSTGALAFACLAAGYVERWRRGGQPAMIWLVVAAAIGVFALVGSTFPVILQGRSLAAVALCLFGVMVAWRYRAGAAERETVDRLMVWVVLGGLLLAKFAFRPSLAHYGFVLAMPVVVLLIAILWERLPELLCPETGGQTCRTVLALLLVADVLGTLSMTTVNLVQKDVKVGQGADRFFADGGRGANEVAAAVNYLAEKTPTDATVMVLPEGVMLNYLARRTSSTPYVNLCPPELSMYGEDTIARTMANKPADYIVLVNKDVSEYGKAAFGEVGYGATLMQWVRRHYQVTEVFGSGFTDPTEHGVTILTRRTP